MHAYDLYTNKACVCPSTRTRARALSLSLSSLSPPPSPPPPPPLYVYVCVCVSLCVCHAHTHTHTQVREAYESALRFDPAHPNALENMQRFFWSEEAQGKEQPRTHEQPPPPAAASRSVSDLPTAPPKDFGVGGWGAVDGAESERKGATGKGLKKKKEKKKEEKKKKGKGSTAGEARSEARQEMGTETGRGKRRETVASSMDAPSHEGRAPPASQGGIGQKATEKAAEQGRGHEHSGSGDEVGKGADRAADVGDAAGKASPAQHWHAWRETDYRSALAGCDSEAEAAGAGGLAGARVAGASAGTAGCSDVYRKQLLNNLGVLLVQRSDSISARGWQGRVEREGLLTEAHSLLEAALALLPSWPEAQHNYRSARDRLRQIHER